MFFTSIGQSLKVSFSLFRLILCLNFFLLITGCDYISSNNSVKTSKIGVISFSRIQQECKQGKELQELSRKANQELEQLRLSLVQSIEREVDQARKVLGALSEEARKAKAQEIEKKRLNAESELKNKRDALEKFIQEKRLQFIDSVKKTAKEVAKRKGLDIVLDNGLIVFNSEHLDISSEVISLLNSE
ncbi:MAG: OmpH family outer membrane protein [Deltaproteobacteria bacterium]|nr:OmpH family outer membrane protein [Deltaproteobacteria bacterium]